MLSKAISLRSYLAWAGALGQSTHTFVANHRHERSKIGLQLELEMLPQRFEEKETNSVRHREHVDLRSTEKLKKPQESNKALT